MFWLLAWLVSLSAGPSSVQPESVVWRDPAGAPLPFQTDEELLRFLRDATVLEEHDIGAGVNHSLKVLLERDGVRAHAVFREVHLQVENQRLGERLYSSFTDSYLGECAAYELSRLLGIRGVPPVVRRRLGEREGSLQVWVEDTLDETGRDFRPRSPALWVGQLWEMYLFDNLLYNVDRNSGNVLVDRGYRLWMIDHTRAFQTVSELLDERVLRARRRTYALLKALTEASLEEALGEYLDPLQIRSLLVRRDLLVSRIDALAAERGEHVVFY